MQRSMFDSPVSAPNKVPTMLVRNINAEYMAVRFRQIGNTQRFGIVLGRFRYDFPLANCQEIDGQAWWVVAASQYTELEAFAQRNGLQLVKE
jgi:hypothetical protein